MRQHKNAEGSRLKAEGFDQKSASSLRPRASGRAADLLFEIGTEELPAAYLPDLIAQLRDEAGTLFEAAHLPCRDIRSFGTPRRLVLLARGLATLQQKPGEEVRGPSKQASYDKDGKPTPALQGFLRSQGGTPAQVKTVSSAKGEYLYLLKPPTTTPASKVLAALLPQLVARLHAPKTMRWDGSGVRFARPIRWLLALHGATPIRCSLGRVVSAPATWVGGPLRPRRLRIASLEGYLRALKAAGVLLDHDQRRAWIEQTVARIATSSSGIAAPELASHGLLDEVTFLVEQPVSLVGQFDRTYLQLPREVLLASMAKYQRVFAIEARGTLLPQCIAILEGSPSRPAQVRKVIERILNARLADSLMFWREDRERSLEMMKQDLGSVTFHEKLGSMNDKMLRLSGLCGTLADAWRLTSQEAGALRLACEYSKADLVSAMVKEFPTLQGIVGKHYAKEAGQSQAVADAIGEQYLPLAGQRPTTLLGSALAVLDKYDTLASYFSVGIEPTGDQDPFGLRRAAQGIVEVAWAIHRPLPLSSLFAAWRPLAPFAKGNTDTAARIHRYALERLYTFAWPARPGDSQRRAGEPAPSVDCIDAVLSSDCDDLTDAMERIAALQRLAGHPGLRKAAKVIERTRNILKGTTPAPDPVQTSLLQEAPERALWDIYEQHNTRVAELITQRRYEQATTSFGDAFYEPLHAFFGTVLVNVPDEALKRNRLALMRAINTLYTDRVADLSKLALLQHQEPSS